MLLLEKVACLFEILTRSLPKYKYLLPSFKLDFRAATDGRVELLSHLFADLVQLFLELYCMFSRAQGMLRFWFLTYCMSLESRLWEG